MKFKKKILKNGMRVILVPTPDSLTATVLVLVETGSKYETKDINGISHFLEHMCFKGTVKRPKMIDIATEFDGIGAQNNAFTGQEYTGYWAKASFKKVEKLLDILSDVYINPIFDKGEINKEKGVVIGEMNMYEDMPSRQVHQVFSELLHGDQPAGWDIIGTKAIIKNIKREDLVAYRDKHYVASATTVIVSGKFDEKKILEQIKVKFKDISTAKKQNKKRVIEKQSKPQLAIKYKKTDQAHIVVGFRSYGVLSKHSTVLSVISGVLGAGMSSRLFYKLREEMGVGYYVHAHNDSSTDHGVLQASAGVDNKRIKEVVIAITEEFKKLKEELVSDKELKKVKDYIVGNMYLGLESSDEWADFYGTQEVLKKEEITPQEVAKRLRSVTPAQIMSLASKIFTNDRLNMALVGPFKDKKALKKLLKV